MELSTKGAHLIESFEGFVPHAYQDAVGVWTIGFGSTKGVGPGTKPITRAQAERRMMREVDLTYGAAVNKLGVPVNQNQFDALVSFVYNLGPGALAPDTGIGRALRAHDWDRAADEMLKWDKAGGRTLEGLTRRRRAERELFRKPDEWAGYTESEVRWIREYDRHPPLARRLTLRLVMRQQARRIRSAARKDGWTGSRRQRVKSLDARS